MRRSFSLMATFSSASEFERLLLRLFEGLPALALALLLFLGHLSPLLVLREPESRGVTWSERRRFRLSWSELDVEVPFTDARFVEGLALDGTVLIGRLQHSRAAETCVRSGRRRRLVHALLPRAHEDDARVVDHVGLYETQVEEIAHVYEAHYVVVHISTDLKDDVFQIWFASAWLARVFLIHSLDAVSTHRLARLEVEEVELILLLVWMALAHLEEWRGEERFQPVPVTTMIAEIQHHDSYRMCSAHTHTERERERCNTHTHNADKTEAHNAHERIHIHRRREEHA